jgi:membrane fusion protein (multidrug efflux system)
MSNGHENDDDRPDEYRYRYKYLYKYGDDQPSSGKEDDKKKDEDKDGEDQKGKDDKDSKNDKEKKDGGQKKDGEDDRKKKRKRILVMAIIAGVFVLAALTWLLLYIFIFSQRETTDDAYLHGDLVTISPRVPGTVVEIAVEETEFVHAGQVLVRLDPADAQVSLMNAQGQLAQAVRNAQQSIQQAAEADAVVAQRRAQYLTQRDEYDRRFPLVDVHAVAREEASNAERQMRAGEAALEQAERQAAAAHALVDGTDVRTFPAVIQARSQFRNAWINSNRNAIVSPVDGYASRRQVQVGQRVQPGQDLLTIVPLNALWVDANFKETQLQNIRIGQPVTLTTDIYSHVTYHGKVVGFNAGTGSAFSLLPAENATGNWIKVVQRLPVRIAIDPNELKKHTLWVGLSAYVNVNTHDRSGLMISSQVRHKPLLSTDVYEREVNEADQSAEAIIRANTVALPGSDTHTMSGGGR